MKTSKNIMLLIALLAASCSQQEEDPMMKQGNSAISFNAVVADAETRADGEWALSDLKAESSSGFGVFAASTSEKKYSDSNVQTDYMHNQQVVWDNTTSKWTYSPVKYWPSGEGVNAENPRFVSFFAYAPYSDMDASDPDAYPAGYCISGFNQAHVYGDPWLTYRLHPDVNKQVDLLYAKQLDVTRPQINTPINLQFAHALSCVGDEVSISVSDEMKTALRSMVSGSVSSVELVMTDVSITYTLAEKGRLVLWNKNGAANWQTVLSEGLTTERVPTITASLPVTLYTYDGSETVNVWEDTGHGVFFIPVDPDAISQTATITISFQVILNGTVVYGTHERTSEVRFDATANAGKKVALHIMIKNLNP